MPVNLEWKPFTFGHSTTCAFTDGAPGRGAAEEHAARDEKSWRRPVEELTGGMRRFPQDIGNNLLSAASICASTGSMQLELE